MMTMMIMMNWRWWWWWWWPVEQLLQSLPELTMSIIDEPHPTDLPPPQAAKISEIERRKLIQFAAWPYTWEMGIPTKLNSVKDVNHQLIRKEKAGLGLRPRFFLVWSEAKFFLVWVWGQFFSSLGLMQSFFLVWSEAKIFLVWYERGPSSTEAITLSCFKERKEKQRTRSSACLNSLQYVLTL